MILIDGDAKEETEEYGCTETTWGVFFHLGHRAQGACNIRYEFHNSLNRFDFDLARPNAII